MRILNILKKVNVLKKAFLMASMLTITTFGSVQANSEPNYIFGTFFTSNEDTQVQCYVSEDGVNMTYWLPLFDLSGRDPSCRIYNNNLYICLVEPTDSEKTFYITKLNLSNLGDKTATSHTVIERGNARYIWAPDLFVDDDGSGYVYFAKEKERTKEIKNLQFDIYVSKTPDIESKDFEPAQKINLPASSNSYIDAHILKVNGKYYMIVKNEMPITNNENKSPLMFKSDSPMFETYEEVTDWPLKSIRGYEGFSMLEKDGRIFIYADNFTHKYDSTLTSNYTVWIADKNNIETGPYKADYVVTDNRTLRHGSLILIDDSYVKQEFRKLNFPAFQKFNTNADKPKLIKLKREDYGDGSGKDKNFAINYFAPAPNVIYSISNKTSVEIKSISNPYGVKDFKITLTDGVKLKVLDNPIEKSLDSGDETFTFVIDEKGAIQNIIIEEEQAQ